MTARNVPPKGYKSKTEWVRVSDVNVDPTYQRGLNRVAVRRMADNFDPARLGTLHISRRTDGSMWAIDGQHRIELLHEVGWEDRKVKCEVYDDLTVDQESDLFVGLNNSTAVRALDQFIARIAAGELVATRINNVCENYGLVIHRQPGENHVHCVTAMERVYNGHGVRRGASTHLPELDKTIATLVAAYGPTSDAVSGHLVAGVGLLFLRYGDDIDPKRLAKKLAEVPMGASGVIGKARGMREYRGGSLPHATAEFLVDLYNRGMRTNRLPEWRR